MTDQRGVAMYLRLSVENKRQGMEESSSIANQRKLLLDYLRKEPGLSGKEVWEFCDDGYSGTNMQRPGVQTLLEAVRDRRVQCILVKDMSRFSRDYIELGNYLNQIFPFLGVRFIAVNDGYDSGRQKETAIAIDTAFQSLVYDLYSRDLSWKLKAALRSKSDVGEYVFAKLPFGYERSKEAKNQVVVKEGEAAVVRRVFSLAAEGKGTTEIAKILHQEGIPTAMQMRAEGKEEKRKDLSWSAHKVRRILNNRFYAGDMIYAKSRRESVGSKKAVMLPKQEWKVIPDHHEALVPPEIFALACKDGPKQERTLNNKKMPLAGKVFCGGCGYAMNHKMPSGQKRYLQFWCKNHTVLQIPECCTYWNGTVLEELVLFVLNLELLKRGDPKVQREALERFQGNCLESVESRYRERRKQCRQIQIERDGLYEQYAAGDITAETYRRLSDQWQEELLVLEEEIRELSREYDLAKEECRAKKQDIKQIARYCHMETLTREMADSFIKRIALYQDKRVEIECGFSEGKQTESQVTVT